jgi:hypothetical protein
MRKEKKPIVLQKKSTPMYRARLIKECSKMDPKVEKAMAEEGFTEDMKNWPEY